MITTAIALPTASVERGTPLVSLGPWRCADCRQWVTLHYHGVVDGWEIRHAPATRCPASVWRAA